MLINIMASFGAGKSSLVKILGDDLNAKKYLEDPYAISDASPQLDVKHRV